MLSPPARLYVVSKTRQAIKTFPSDSTPNFVVKVLSKDIVEHKLLMVAWDALPENPIASTIHELNSLCCMTPRV